MFVKGMNNLEKIPLSVFRGTTINILVKLRDNARGVISELITFDSLKNKGRELTLVCKVRYDALY